MVSGQIAKSPKKRFSEMWMRSPYCRLHMALDLQSFFGLHVYSCTHWLRPHTPPPPALELMNEGRYWSAKIDDISDTLRFSPLQYPSLQISIPR